MERFRPLLEQAHTGGNFTRQKDFNIRQNYGIAGVLNMHRDAPPPIERVVSPNPKNENQKTMWYMFKTSWPFHIRYQYEFDKAEKNI